MRRYREDADKYYYMGYCCVHKDDVAHQRNRDLPAIYEYPCFLAYDPDTKKFGIHSMGWYDYISEGNDVNNLWCEVSKSDPRQSIPNESIQEQLNQLEAIFPEYKFYATLFPSKYMNENYKFGLNMSEEEWDEWWNNSDLGKAYQELNEKLRNVNSAKRDIWVYPY